MTMDCVMYGFMNILACSSRFIGKTIVAIGYTVK